jgi:hypothetical protein
MPVPFGPRKRVHSCAWPFNPKAATTMAMDVLARKVFMRSCKNTLSDRAVFYLLAAEIPISNFNF